jgi:hypothetical protein
MKLVAKIVLAAALVAGLAGGAMAENNTKAKPNYKDFAAAWYYPWVSPATGANTGEVGIPDKGVVWQKDFSGEVVYIDDLRMQVKADGSGDIMNFFLYEGITRYYPSWMGIHEGSKVNVRSDDRHRVRWVEVVPFYKWLAKQTK